MQAKVGHVLSSGVSRPASPSVTASRSGTPRKSWFWTMGLERPGGTVPADSANHGRVIIKCLDALYRRRRIDLLHARILRIWGERQVSPKPRFPVRAQ